ncbi:MAG: hypothetical protein JWN92_3061 [Candidatus Acidoferrum typicum]|nr:hypothetical protein [Candidatus Acidoferrum typicum]
MLSSKFWGIGRILAIFCLVSFAICPAMHANTLDSSIISMFPIDVSDVKYVDLSGSRQYAWFPQFQVQVVPNDVLGLEQLLEAAHGEQPAAEQPAAEQQPTEQVAGEKSEGQPEEGPPPERLPSIDQVVWARFPISGSAQAVAIGMGQFDIEGIKMFLNSHGVSSISGGTYEIYAAQPDLGMPEGCFTLIDNRTVAVGSLEGLKRILEIRAQKQANLLENTNLMNLIKQVNGQALFWSVLDSVEAQTTVKRLVPEIMKFPQANDVVMKLKQLSISLKAADNMQIDMRVNSASAKDAVVLSQLLEASMLSRRHQSAQDNPELAKILDGMAIAPSGNQLNIRLTVTDDQMRGLGDQNTFSLLM